MQVEIKKFKNAEDFSKSTGLYGIDAVEYLLNEIKKEKQK